MEYIAVEWIHEFPREPVLIYSELDEDRHELRKIELFADGTAGMADDLRQTKDTRLSIVPLPVDEEISADIQFRLRRITADEFDRLWLQHTCK